MVNNNEAQNFCKNVLYLRQKNNLTQTQMAQIMEVGIGTVRLLEHGILPPRLRADVLYRLRDHFRVCIAALFYPQKL